MISDKPIALLRSIDLIIGDNILLKQFDLTVYEGEIVCIAGQSGRGKSSLLKVLQGYLLPQCGTVEVCGSLLTPEMSQQIRSQIIDHAYPTNPQSSFLLSFASMVG